MNVRIQDGVAVIELTKDLDVSAAEALEQCYLDLLERDAQFFVIGFDHANLMTSDGIRVLLELTRKLESRDGSLMLYGLGHRVRTILNVTRLIDRFQIVGSYEKAVAAIAERRRSRPSSPHRRSLLTRLVGQVVSAETVSSTGRPTAEASSRSKSTVTVELARLFGQDRLDRSP